MDCEALYAFLSDGPFRYMYVYIFQERSPTPAKPHKELFECIITWPQPSRALTNIWDENRRTGCIL